MAATLWLQHDGNASGELERFVENFRSKFDRRERRHWCAKYLEGLLLEGERQSIEPMSARVEGGNEQALQQFVNQSPWTQSAVMEKLRAWMFSRTREQNAVLVLVLNDTNLPKQGRHSVGVARQYCGALGRIANCQSAVSWHWPGERSHWPLDARLYLPKEWTCDRERLEQAGAPAPEDRAGIPATEGRTGPGSF
ncbi:MAG TPA: transposase [Candidatus Limnocylindria bacterium]|nr:transposase [Candidatus Limnocylindria bacterium]